MRSFSRITFAALLLSSAGALSCDVPPEETTTESAALTSGSAVIGQGQPAMTTADPDDVASKYNCSGTNGCLFAACYDSCRWLGDRISYCVAFCECVVWEHSTIMQCHAKAHLSSHR